MTEQWYTNKDLYEMIFGLRQELQSTTEAVKRYNNLHARIEESNRTLREVCETVAEMRAEGQGKNSLSEGLLLYGGWLLALLTYLRLGG